MKNKLKDSEPKNKIEILNREFSGLDFIKKYEVLRTTNLSTTQIDIIELILSFQLSGESFFMSRRKMAARISVNIQTVKNNVSQLRDLGILVGQQIPNEDYGGSKAPLKVDIDALIQYIKDFKQTTKVKITELPTEAKEEPVEEVCIDHITVVPPSLVKSSKSELKETTEPDLSKELVFTDKEGVNDITYNDELDRILKTNEIDNRKESTFDVEEWMKSSVGSDEFYDSSYHDLINEVEKRYSYKNQISKNDYLDYFKQGRYKQPHLERLGIRIYEAHRKEKPNL